MIRTRRFQDQCWKIFILLGMLSCSSALFAQQKKQMTPAIAFKSPPLTLTKQLPNISSWLDDNRYVESRKEGDVSKEVIVDAKSSKVMGEKKPEIKWEDFKAIAGEGIDVSKPVLSGSNNTRHVYQKENDLFLLDVKKKAFTRLTSTPFEEKNPTFSPDGNYLAFTRENNLYVIDLATAKERQLTTDGGEVVYNGWAAWVYFEEIFGRPTRYRAFWWSPDSKHLAFYRFDESMVPMFPLTNSRGQHGTLERTHYPKAGDPNPMVKIGIADAVSGAIVWSDFNEKDDQYFGTPVWSPEGKEFWVQWMNRGQDNLKLYSIDPATGVKKERYDERQNSWVEWLDGVHFLKDGKGYILKSDKDGWMHFYLYTMDGTLKNRITEGKWQVVNSEFVDEENTTLFFTAKKEASTRVDLYKIHFDGTGLKRLTFENMTHSVKLSSKGSYFITTYSNVSTPPKMAVCDKDGNVLREIGNSWQKELDEYELAKTELVTFPTTDGYQLPALITMPPNLDPGRKYPVLISVYGGPNAGTVADGWRLSMQAQGLAAEGMIHVAVDHRASGHFGKEGVALMHRNLGKWEMNDYIEAVKWLRTKPYVDSSRICITGGSYGGYVTCMALTAGADYFPYGIASSSVTDWKLYDTHYTEKFMDTPEENPEGYKNGSVMTYAKNYKGLLRIVHGSTDDNVHIQNSLQLVDTLENLTKHFEFMVYPNERHGWGPPKSDHSRMEALRFYYKYLLQKEYPESAFAKQSKQQP